MRGMDAVTGRALEGDAHLAQSIGRILSTPIGTRCMRRDFGSILPELIDQPFNALTRTRMYGAVAVAIGRWEKRLRPTRFTAEQLAPGQIELTVEGYRTDRPTNSFIRLTVPLRSYAAAA